MLLLFFFITITASSSVPARRQAIEHMIPLWVLPPPAPDRAPFRNGVSIVNRDQWVCGSDHISEMTSQMALTQACDEKTSEFRSSTTSWFVSFSRVQLVLRDSRQLLRQFEGSGEVWHSLLQLRGSEHFLKSKMQLSSDGYVPTRSSLLLFQPFRHHCLHNCQDLWREELWLWVVHCLTSPDILFSAPKPDRMSLQAYHPALNLTAKHEYKLLYDHCPGFRSQLSSSRFSIWISASRTIDSLCLQSQSLLSPNASNRKIQPRLHELSGGTNQLSRRSIWILDGRQGDVSEASEGCCESNKGWCETVGNGGGLVDEFGGSRCGDELDDGRE